MYHLRTRLSIGMLGAVWALLQGSCSDLWKGSLVADQRNCAIAPAVCGDFEECDYVTETCKPLPPPSCPVISLESITPSVASRVGGTKITITGSGFEGEMRVEIDGTPLANVGIEGSSQLSGTLGGSPSSCGPSAVTLISSCFERVSKAQGFSYSLDPLQFDSLPQILPSASGTSSEQILLEDVNSDGDPDIIGIEPSGVRSFLSDGTGSFTTTGAQPLGSTLFQAALGDVTGDKFLDLVITDQTNPRLWFLSNGGKGSFAPQSIPMPEPLRGAALADLTGDGKSDALAVGQSGVLYLLAGTSSGLSAAVSAATGLPVNSQFVALADVTGDGQPELLVPGGASQLVEVWQKSGPQSFTRLAQKPVSGFATSVAVTDAQSHYELAPNRLHRRRRIGS